MNISLRRSALIEASKWNLPSAYQRVEYIVNSASGQYIDTGLYLSTNDTFYLDVMPLSIYGTSTTSGFFGARESYTAKNMLAAVDSSGHVSVTCANDSGTAGPSTFLDTVSSFNTRIQIIDNKYYRGIIGKTLNTYERTDSFTTSTTCRIFSTGGQWNVRYVNCRFYLAEIRGRFFGVPCYRKSDNKVGMYDTVGKRFLTSPTGTLVKGANV